MSALSEVVDRIKAAAAALAAKPKVDVDAIHAQGVADGRAQADAENAPLIAELQNDATVLENILKS